MSPKGKLTVTEVRTVIDLDTGNYRKQRVKVAVGMPTFEELPVVGAEGATLTKPPEFAGVTSFELDKSAQRRGSKEIKD